MIETTTQDTLQDSALATPVAPEDIRVGDYLAPMNETMQFVLRGCEPDWQGGDRPPRVHVVTARLVESFPQVMRVLGVGLPFLLVEDLNGTASLTTCRLAEFARLPKEMGQRAMRDLDRRRRKESAKRRARVAKRRAKGDLLGAGASGAD